LQHYVRFQETVIRRRTVFDLKKARDREHILEGLKIVIDHTDEVIRMIRQAEDQPAAKAALAERFGLTDVQAQAIVTMRLGQLSGMERIKIEEELAQVLARVAELEAILADEQKILEIIKEELLTIRKRYADERKTEIATVSGEVDIEDLIPQEDCVVTLTHFGYLKRQPVDVYKTQHRGGRGISGMQRREEDFVEELFIGSTHDYVLFFTSKGRMFRLKGYEIPESSRASRGTNMVNLLNVEGDEKITSMIRVSEVDDEGYLVMVTKNGIIKRTELLGLPQCAQGWTQCHQPG
jgi:DNA gyrase subunit A